MKCSMEDCVKENRQIVCGEETSDLRESAQSRACDETTTTLRASTSVAPAMDERDMKTGVIPLRHSSLPGHVKLPRRYEKAAMGTNGISTRVRKISIQPGSSALGDSLSDRMDDLMSAMMWVKQELIMLRQHDILLKRQFFNIQHSIKSLQKPKSTPSSSTSSTATATTTNTSTTSCNSTSSTHHPISNGDAIIEETDTELDSRMEAVSSYINTDNNNNSSSSRHSSHDNNSDFPMDTYVVRPSSSVTMLHEESEEEEDADTFAEEFFCRPRTSSMRTSRDMAALARRRGSKELI